MFIETEFEDEIDLNGSTYYTFVEVEISGEVERGSETVTNLKIKSIYSKDDKKFINFKDLGHSEGQRLLEKAEDKILNKYINDGDNVYDVDGYNDGNDYYDGNLASIQGVSEE